MTSLVLWGYIIVGIIVTIFMYVLMHRDGIKEEEAEELANTYGIDLSGTGICILCGAIWPVTLWSFRMVLNDRKNRK